MVKRIKTTKRHDRLVAFLKGLTELTNKTGVFIDTFETPVIMLRDLEYDKKANSEIDMGTCAYSCITDDAMGTDSADDPGIIGRDLLYDD